MIFTDNQFKCPGKIPANEKNAPFKWEKCPYS